MAGSPITGCETTQGSTTLSLNLPSGPEYAGRSFYGYDSAEVQAGYMSREARQAADFLMPRLSSGMRILDCGCGPGTITLGLATAVAPGRAVGIDLEPTMIERARRLADQSAVQNVDFKVANICEIPFENDEFDVVFSSSVTEHLSDPVRALREVRRVVRPDGLAAVVKTEWSFPFIVPECPEFTRFFELFEGEFNRIGGSLNRGRFLRSYMTEAGFDVVEFIASMGNTTEAECIASSVEGYITWMDNIPLFRESVDLGITTDEELDSIRAALLEWAQHPDAYIATARTHAVGVKKKDR